MFLRNMSIQLPKLFAMDDYNGCIKRNNLYCKAVAKLKPYIETDDIWTEILKMEADKNLMDRTLVHRGLCIQDHDDNNLQTITQQCEELINREIEQYNLTSKLFRVDCSNGQYSLIMGDYVVMIVVTILLSVITMGTIMYRKIGMHKRYANILNKFSLQHSWKQVTNTNGNEDFKRLKAVQGIRVFFTISVMTIHSNLLFAFLYYSNPEKFEQINSSNQVKQYIVTVFFLVQPFFLISTFLLTIQIYKIKESNQYFTLRDVFVIIINRFFRLGVAGFATILLINSSFLRRLSGIATLEIVSVSEKACKSNWLPTILFYNNFYYAEELCNGVTWSNSADFQMYVIVTLVLYFTFKYQLHEWIVILFIIIFSTIVYGLIIYYFETDIIVRNTMRESEYVYSLRSFSISINYMLTFSIWTTSFVGMALGAIYFKTKHIKVNCTMLASLIWYAMFFGLPLAVILLSTNQYNRLQSALIGSIIKPLYALGIGIGILGMSHNMGGIIKTICERRSIVIFSNFTYCTYLCNWMISMTSYSNNVTAVEMDWSILIRGYIESGTKTIIMGILLTIIVEQPGLSLQKYLLPQLRKHEDNKNGKVH